MLCVNLHFFVNNANRGHPDGRIRLRRRLRSCVFASSSEAPFRLGLSLSRLLRGQFGGRGLACHVKGLFGGEVPSVERGFDPRRRFVDEAGGFGIGETIGRVADTAAPARAMR